MDTLTFIAELVKALAWPVVALVILFVLRRPIFELIPLVQRLRYRGFELDFGIQVQELAVMLRKDLPATVAPGPDSREFRDHLAKLAELSPRAVVLEAWLQLEEAAVEASKRRNLKLSSRESRSPILLGHYLEQAGILDETKQEVFYRLRNLRNAAAHASDFSFDPKSALEYADLAILLADYIQRA